MSNVLGASDLAETWCGYHNLKAAQPALVKAEAPKSIEKDKQGKSEYLKRPYQSVSNKLLYVLEFLLLTVAEQSMLDSFEMKIPRKSLGVPITHIDRAQTYQTVYTGNLY